MRIDSSWQTRNWEQLKEETQARANRGGYPIFGIKPEDAREALSLIHSLDPNEWGSAWMNIGNRYMGYANARKADRKATAAAFLSAWYLYSVGGWPTAFAPRKKESAGRAREAFSAYAKIVEPAIELLSIPFENSTIQAYLQKPAGVDRPPVVISIAGTDLFKDYVTLEGMPLLNCGFANIGVDMPGTADAPVPARPSSERMYSAMIDYIKTRLDLDGDRIIVRGSSWGSYWSARVAFAEPKRLRGVIFQSGPVDAYFSRAWQETAFRTKEFLFDYVPSRLHMLGVETVEEAYELMPLLSLAKEGLLEKPAPPMLLIAGGKDTQVPYSDFRLLLENGSPKTAWVNPSGGTMGRSLTIKDEMIRDTVIIPWIRQRFDAPA